MYNAGYNFEVNKTNSILRFLYLILFTKKVHVIMFDLNLKIAVIDLIFKL